MREETAQLNDVLKQHDWLQRHGVLHDALSFEGAIAACERWHLGERVAMMLSGLRDEWEEQSEGSDSRDLTDLDLQGFT